jgi:hypothetical protein
VHCFEADYVDWLGTFPVCAGIHCVRRYYKLVTDGVDEIGLDGEALAFKRGEGIRVSVRFFEPTSEISRAIDIKSYLFEAPLREPRPWSDL